MLTLAGQTLVGLPCSFSQSSLHLPPRLQPHGKRLRPMGWPSCFRTTVERRSRHSWHPQCNRPDKSEPGLFLPTIRHGRLRRIPRGLHRSSKSHHFDEHHSRSCLVWHGDSNLYTLPNRVCRLSKGNRGSDLHVQDSLLARPHICDCPIPRRSPFLRDESQRLRFLSAGGERCRLAEPVRLACRFGESSLENVHHLGVLVSLPSSGDIYFDTGNQGPYGQSILFG